MHGLAAFLLASSCAILAFWATTAQAQSGLPAFSNPYGGVATFVGTGAARSSGQKSSGTKISVHKSARRTGAREVSAHRTARKRAISRATRRDVAAKDLTMKDTALKDLNLSSTTTPRPLVPHDAAATKSQNGELGFALKWSAEDDPHYNTSTSTVPAIDEIKRNANETPAESGSTIEGGLNFKF